QADDLGHVDGLPAEADHQRDRAARTQLRPGLRLEANDLALLDRLAVFLLDVADSQVVRLGQLPGLVPRVAGEVGHGVPLRSARYPHLDGTALERAGCAFRIGPDDFAFGDDLVVLRAGPLHAQVRRGQLALCRGGRESGQPGDVGEPADRVVPRAGCGTGGYQHDEE